MITGASGFEVVPIVIELLAPDVPQLVVHVAVYAIPGLTTLVNPLPPPVHDIVPPTQPLAVKVAVSLAHTAGLSDVNTGALGVIPFVITTGSDAALSPHIVIHFAVYVPSPTVTLVAVKVAL